MAFTSSITDYINTPSLTHICTVLILYYTSILLPSSVTLDLSVGFFNNGNECNRHTDIITPSCQSALSKATMMSGITVAIQQLLAFTTAPIIGQFSDVYGRIIPLFSSIGIVFFTTLSLVLYQANITTLWLYFFMRGICGLTEGMSVGLAYVSDITVPNKRLYSFGTLTACLSISLILAPLIGTLFDRTLLFSVASIVALIALLYAACILPESLHKSNRINTWNYAYINPIHGMSILNRTKMFRRLAMTCFFSNAVLEGTFSVLILYFKHQFIVDEQMQAGILAVWGGTGLIAQTLLIRIIMYYGTNRAVFRIGLIFSLIATPLYGCITQPWQVWLVLPINACGMVIFPSISTMKSNNVRTSEQGNVQGALYAVRALGGIVGSLVFTSSFAIFGKSNSTFYIPAMPFWLGTGLSIVSVILGFYVPRQLSVEEQKQLLDDTNIINNNHTCVTPIISHDEYAEPLLHKSQKIYSPSSDIINNDKQQKPYKMQINEINIIDPTM